MSPPIRRRAMGRLYAADERDRGFPAGAILTATTARAMEWWDEGWHGDQMFDPHCVAFAWAHWLADGPRPISLFESRRPGVDTTELYCEAQKRDPWPGDCDNPLYDGTSVRAGAKVLQSWGHIREYRWSYTATEVAQAILTLGPVIVGTLWYQGMSYPDREGVMHITGSPEGGHAYVVNAVNLDTGLFRIKNSWGRDWGLHGRAYISLDNMQTLLDAFGDACIPIQRLPA